MTMYVQIDDCQNNTEVIVKVDANNTAEAEAKALKALHAEDRLYVIDAEEAQEFAEDGITVIDEDGDEVDFEEDDE